MTNDGFDILKIHKIQSQPPTTYLSPDIDDIRTWIT